MNHPEKSHKILVVDDDPYLLDLLVDTLSALGYDVTGAGGGVEALQVLNKIQFDLVITDIKMPDVDGLQLLRKVRRHYPQMPVLFITGVATKNIIGQAAPDGFLAKPFRISQIETLIEDALLRRSGSFPTRMPRVLIVGEDEQLQRSVSDILTHLQFLPFHVPHGHAAMNELENGPIDIVVTDETLSDMDGATLGRSIKERYPRMKVVLTRKGEGDDSPARQIINPDFDGFLRRPFEPTEFLALLNGRTDPGPPVK